MINSNSFKIADDSGFIGIVNADQYKSFVKEDWDLSELQNHFINEMNNNNLILWSTGSENVWTINFLGKPSDNKSFRDFYKSIIVTNGRLYLTTYDDLTMAAQFEDEIIPSTPNADLELRLENGRYEFQIRQLFDPTDHDYDSDGKVNFEIVVHKDSNNNNQTIDNVFWWTQ